VLSDTFQLSVADAYYDDLPGLIQTWPALRRISVARRAPRAVTAIAAQPGADAAREIELSRRARSLAESAAATRLDASAAAGLPARARAAFHTFLRGSYPRAFAVATSGQTGMAIGGASVIERALRNCRHEQSGKKSTCRLFAVDDTLVSSLQRVADKK
jgi:hypothetical protein